MNNNRCLSTMHILGQNLRRKVSMYVKYTSTFVLGFNSKLHYGTEPLIYSGKVAS